MVEAQAQSSSATAAEAEAEERVLNPMRATGGPSASATTTTTAPFTFPPTEYNLTQYDDLVQEALSKNNPLQRVPYSDVLVLPPPTTTTTTTTSNNTSSTTSNQEEEEENNIRVGHILVLLPESRNGQVDDIGHTVDAFLALRDFNRRQSIFPHSNIFDLVGECNFYMRMSFRDSGRNFFQVATEWQDAFFPLRQKQQQDRPEDDDYAQLPLAVVGPAASHMSATVSTLGTATSNDPQGVNTGVISVSYGSTAAYLDNKERYPWFARTSTTDSQGIAQALLQYYVQHVQAQQVAILHVDSGFALDVVAHILAVRARDPLFRDYIKDIKVISYVENNPQSMAAAAMFLQKQGIVYHVGIQLSEAMILQLYDTQLLGPQYETDGTSDDDTTTTAGSNNQKSSTPVWTFYGSVTTNYMNRQVNNQNRLGDVHQALHRSTYITSDSSTWADDIQLRNRAILDEQLRLFHDDPAAVDYVLQRHHGRGIFGQNHSLFYDMLDTAANPTTTSNSKRWYIYDAIMAVGLATCQSPTLETPVLYDTLKHLNFRGGSYQEVAFNTTTGTRLPTHVAYKLYNLERIQQIRDASSSEIALHHALTYVSNNTNNSNNTTSNTHNNATWLTLTTILPVVFPNGFTTQPAALPPAHEDMNLVSLELRAFCWAIAGIVMMASLVCAIYICIHARDIKRPKLIASQPIFLFVLCIGTFLMACSIYPLTWQEPMEQHILDTGCMLQVWLLSIGFSTTFAVLFTKTWRISRLFQSAASFRRNRVTASSVTWVPASVFGLNIAILSIWTVLEPLHWDRTVSDRDYFGRALQSQGRCFHFNSFVSPFLGALLIGINFCAFVVAGYQAFKARQLPGAFNESAQILGAIACILEAFMIGIPLLSVLEVHPTAFTVVASWIIAIAAMAVLVPIVGTKLVESESGGETHPLSPLEMMASVRKSKYTTNSGQLSTDDLLLDSPPLESAGGGAAGTVRHPSGRMSIIRRPTFTTSPDFASTTFANANNNLSDSQFNSSLRSLRQSGFLGRSAELSLPFATDENVKDAPN